MTTAKTPPTPKKPDPSEIYLAAHSYRLAAIAVTEASFKDLRVLFPSFMLEAFTMELYLKCLLSIEKKTAPWDHNLRKLFDRLSVDNRNRIVALSAPAIAKLNAKYRRADPVFASHPITFEGALDESSKAFENIRYLHETIGTPKFSPSWVAGGIANAVRARILELEPTFANLEQQSRFIDPAKNTSPPEGP
jgi:hypothetical protein